MCHESLRGESVGGGSLMPDNICSTLIRSMEAEKHGFLRVINILSSVRSDSGYLFIDLIDYPSVTQTEALTGSTECKIILTVPSFHYSSRIVLHILLLFGPEYRATILQ